VIEAYILIEAEPGKTRNLVRQLEDREGILEVSRVYGPCDVVALVEADDASKVNDIINEHIYPVGGVLRTTTCLVLD